jgi:hypothetical protein
MVDVITEIEIMKPIEEVSNFASDPNNATKWYKNIKTVEWKKDGNLKLGAQIAFKAHFLGRELAYVYEVVEMKMPCKFVMKTADGPFPMETTYEWEVVNESTTRMTLRNRGNPSGFKSIFAPFMSMAMRKANQKELHLLKSILEKNASS